MGSPGVGFLLRDGVEVSRNIFEEWRKRER
jgi:hypothetical protein